MPIRHVHTVNVLALLGLALRVQMLGHLSPVLRLLGAGLFLLFTSAVVCGECKLRLRRPMELAVNSDQFIPRPLPDLAMRIGIGALLKPVGSLCILSGHG